MGQLDKSLVTTTGSLSEGMGTTSFQQLEDLMSVVGAISLIVWKSLPWFRGFLFKQDSARKKGGENLW